MLIAGHRRLAALQQLAAEAPEDPRWRKALAVERVADEQQAVILALVENLHREDLKPQDEASALEALEHELGSLQAVANAIKRSKAYVSRRIRVYQGVRTNRTTSAGHTWAKLLLERPHAGWIPYACATRRGNRP